MPDWNVSASGAFVYSIPIDLPPGRHGMRPKLSLVYSSLADNGIAGMGWTLAGIPVITRVTSNVGIRYAGNDVYALNRNGWGNPNDPSGQLVKVNTQSYHTVVETLGDYKPQAVGDCGDGPCYWIERDGSGITWTFGYPGQENMDSVIWEPVNGETSGRGILAWGLVKAVDVYGNGFRVEYLPLKQVGPTLYPARIIYSTHETKLVTTHEINFEYEPRPDTTPPPGSFHRRLKSIRSSSKREYRCGLSSLVRAP